MLDLLGLAMLTIIATLLPGRAFAPGGYYETSDLIFASIFVAASVHAETGLEGREGLTLMCRETPENTKSFCACLADRAVGSFLATLVSNCTLSGSIHPSSIFGDRRRRVNCLRGTSKCGDHGNAGRSPPATQFQNKAAAKIKLEPPRVETARRAKCC